MLRKGVFAKPGYRQWLFAFTITGAHHHGAPRLVFFSGEKGITPEVFFIGQTPLAHAHNQGYWAVDVSGNRRIVFRFEGQDVIDVDYLDYH